MYFDSNPYKLSYLSKSLETEKSRTFEKVSLIIFKRGFIDKQELELTSIYIQRKLNLIYFQLCIKYHTSQKSLEDAGIFFWGSVRYLGK